MSWAATRSIFGSSPSKSYFTTHTSSSLKALLSPFPLVGTGIDIARLDGLILEPTGHTLQCAAYCGKSPC
eukprot:CAMPEP_0181507948 /NCGR_PEP_ID=MMETSP1110-20121109/59447_1 /TAXON_ID=174948 /ORGANISM="Symbiodinium sp., Strain CCMP421" /LENGTH=69 /DNA_ID=CAMNT_0023637201 /DNA_START=166 /DNA_END=372 /DNA_ORIENTATION=+